MVNFLGISCAVASIVSLVSALPQPPKAVAMGPCDTCVNTITNVHVGTVAITPAKPAVIAVSQSNLISQVAKARAQPIEWQCTACQAVKVEVYACNVGFVKCETAVATTTVTVNTFVLPSVVTTAGYYKCVFNPVVADTATAITPWVYQIQLQ